MQFTVYHNTHPASAYPIYWMFKAILLMSFRQN
ncbi:hypothetical protein JOE25_000281 [Serratia sp. PL17]|nr:hypothetical protein [Serratia sp. PL17]